MLLVIGICAASVCALLAIDFFLWRRSHVRKVHAQLNVADIGGQRISYVDIGQGEPVLYVFGGGSGPDSAPQFQWLADAGYRLISVNRPGYLDMPVPNGLSFASQADSYAALLRHLRISKAHVFGVSMGGPTSLLFAEQHSEMTQSLLLWSAVAKQYAPNTATTDTLISRVILTPGFKDVLSWLLARVGSVAPGQIMREFLRATAGLSPRAANDLIEQELAKPGRRAEFAAFMNALLPMSLRHEGMMLEVVLAAQPWPSTLEAFRGPLFVAHSSIDIDVPLEHQQHLRDARPDGVFVTVQAGGHFCFWGDEGEQVRDATLAFLRANPITQHAPRLAAQ